MSCILGTTFLGLQKFGTYEVLVLLQLYTPGFVALIFKAM